MNPEHDSAPPSLPPPSPYVSRDEADAAANLRERVAKLETQAKFFIGLCGLLGSAAVWTLIEWVRSLVRAAGG